MSGIPWLIAMGEGRECCRHYCICPASRQQRKPRSGIGRRYRAWRLLHLSGFRFTLCVACRMLSPTFIIQENSMTHALRHLPAALTARGGGAVPRPDPPARRLPRFRRPVAGLGRAAFLRRDIQPRLRRHCAVGLAAARAEPAAPGLRHGWAGYRLFLAGLFLTALGSSWYHLAPDNAAWSGIACRSPWPAAACWPASGATCPAKGKRSLAAWLALAAIASVAWWRFTDLSGAGDLRPYLLLQGLPILLIPLWQWIYKVPGADRLAFGGALAIYVVAKFAEAGRPRNRRRARAGHRPYPEAPAGDGRRRADRRAAGVPPAGAAQGLRRCMSASAAISHERMPMTMV
jgi:hypothetical protein